MHFAESMSVGLPANLRFIVRVQSIGNSVYLLATETFERHRVLMRSTTDGSIVVFDLAADTEPAVSKNVDVRSAENSADIRKESKNFNNAVLSRFAA